MFVELVYDKRNVEGLEGASEIILAELTKRVHQLTAEMLLLRCISRDLI